MPTGHRDGVSSTLAGQLTVTRHPHGCLVISPRGEWEPLHVHAATWPISAQRGGRGVPGNALGGVDRLRATPGWRAATVMGKHFGLRDTPPDAAREAEAMKGAMPDVFEDFCF